MRETVFFAIRWGKKNMSVYLYRHWQSAKMSLRILAYWIFAKIQCHASRTESSLSTLHQAIV